MVLADLLLSLPAWLILLGIAFTKKTAYPAGFCQHCGYDIRATPDRCPECGAVAINPTAN